MSVDKHLTWKDFLKTLHCSKSKLYQFELRAVLVVFLSKWNSFNIVIIE